jgi:hypothetical protein
MQVQRPEIEPIIYRDLFLFRTLASFLNGISIQKLGCNAELIVDEFGEKLLEELDYTLVTFRTCCLCHSSSLSAFNFLKHQIRVLLGILTVFFSVYICSKQMY